MGQSSEEALSRIKIIYQKVILVDKIILVD